MPILIIALMLALASGGGVIYAAHDASPGGMLYGVKAAIEQVELVPQAAQKALGSSLSLSQANKKGKGHGRDDIGGTIGVTGTTSIADTEHISGTNSIGGGNWYSHTVSAISGLSGTIGVTFTKALSNVVGLEEDENVPGQSYRGLAAKLRAAAQSLQRGRAEVAAHQLDAFLHELNAMKRSGHIEEANYDKLYSEYSQLVVALNGTVQQAGHGPRGEEAEEKAKGKGAEQATQKAKDKDSDDDQE